MSTAAKVAASKAAHPEQFCPTTRCLWRTGGGSCPRHAVTALVSNERSRQILKSAASGAGGWILPEEREQMLASGLLSDTPRGLEITPLGRAVLVQS